MKQNKKIQREKRHKRIKAKTMGDAKCPRLHVFRSNKHIYAQLIDDHKGKTLVSAKDIEIKDKPAASRSDKQAGRKSELAFKVGELIAKKALEQKLEKVVFDRAGYKYHGRVKSLADGARQGGLKF